SSQRKTRASNREVVCVISFLKPPRLCRIKAIVGGAGVRYLSNAPGGQSGPVLTFFMRTADIAGSDHTVSRKRYWWTHRRVITPGTARDSPSACGASLPEANGASLSLNTVSGDFQR